ncbi:hypothetical protein D3C72_2177880 [compost metagenome]
MLDDGRPRSGEFDEPSLKVGHTANVVILSAKLGVGVFRRDNISHQMPAEAHLIDEPPVIQNHRPIGQAQQ